MRGQDRGLLGGSIAICLLGAFPPVDFLATCFLGGEPPSPAGFGDNCFCLTMVTDEMVVHWGL